MVTNNAEITILNKRLDPDTRREKLFSTHINGCSWMAVRGTSKTGEAVSPADSVSVRIPYTADTDGKPYINPFDYAGMDNDAARKAWTIADGDIVIFGSVSVDEDARLSEVMDTVGKYFTVTAWSENLFGCKYSWHWRVGGA